MTPPLFKGTSRETLLIRHRVFFWFACAALLALLPVAGAHAREQGSMALPQLQAMYVYSFVKFTSWPATAFESGAAPIVIGVIEDAPLARALAEATRGKSHQSRPVTVRHLALGAPIANVHVLVLGPLDRADVVDVIRRAAERPILTVSAGERFTQVGGVIGLVTVEGKLRFELNLHAAEEQGLKVTQLVPLALVARGTRK